MKIKTGILSALIWGVLMSPLWALEAPTNLWPSRGEGNADFYWMHIRWTDNSADEDGYEIQYSANSPLFDQSLRLPANSEFHSFYDSANLQFNTVYYIRVRAFQGTQYSDFSNVIKVVTRYAPGGLKAASYEKNKVELTWESNKTGQYDSFIIERTYDSPTNFTSVQTLIPLLGTNMRDDGGSNWLLNTTDIVTEDHVYYYRVCGFRKDAQACSPYTNVVSVAPNRLPEAPTNLQVSMDDGGRVVARITYPYNNANLLTVEQSVNNNNWVPACTTNPRWNERVCNPSHPQPGVLTYYRAYANNDFGSSGYATTSFFFPVTPSNAASLRHWYVDTAPHGNSDGTSWDKSWTIENINWPVVKPGDTIHISGGIYRTTLRLKKSGTPGAPILLKASQEAAHNSPVLLKGSLFIGANWITLEGGKDDSYAESTIKNNTLHVPLIKNNINFVVDSSETPASGAIMVASNPGPEGIVFRWLEVKAPIVKGATGITINGGDPSKNEIAYCWIHDVGDSGVMAPQNPNPQWDDLTIHHTLIERTGEDGITSAAGLTLHHSIIRDTIYPTLAPWGHPDGLEQADPMYVHVYNNIFSDYQTVVYPGLISPAVHHFYFYGNIIYKDDGPAGVGFDLTYDYRHLATSLTGTFSDIVVANNTIVGTSPHMMNLMSFFNNYGPQGGVITVSRATIANNILYDAQKAQAFGLGGSGWRFDESDVVFDHNNAWSSAAVGNEIFYRDTMYPNAAALNNGTRYKNNTGTRPLFTDETKFDFSLKPEDTSVKNKGSDLRSLQIPTMNYDILGNTRGADGTWDIGAYEYCEGADCAKAALPYIAPQAPQVTWGNFQNVLNLTKESTLTIDFNLSEVGPVKLEVLDRKGKLIRTLWDGPRNPGDMSPAWDGKNTAGTPVSSGVYILKLDAGGTTLTKKLVVVK